MDGLPQPPYVTYRLEGTGDGFTIGLTVIDNKVWLAIRPGSRPAHWRLRHRTYDYASEIVDADDGQRYLSARSFFDPTWYGAYRALREGMLNAQDPAPPRPSPDAPSPTPAPQLRTIGGIAVKALRQAVYGDYDFPIERQNRQNSRFGRTGQPLRKWKRKFQSPFGVQELCLP